MAAILAVVALAGVAWLWWFCWCIINFNNMMQDFSKFLFIFKLVPI